MSLTDSEIDRLVKTLTANDSLVRGTSQYTLLNLPMPPVERKWFEIVARSTVKMALLEISKTHDIIEKAS